MSLVVGASKLDSLHPHFSPAVRFLVDFARENGVDVQITSAYRSREDQARVCASTSYPCAKPGRSSHQYGLAVDIVAGGSVQSAEHKWLRRVADIIGFRPEIKADPVHFEHPAWPMISKELLR